MAKREEDLPLSEKLIKEFCQENKKQWSKVKHTKQYIFINFSMVRMQVGWIIPKLLYAKGVESVTGAKPVVFTWRENPLLTDLFASFDIHHIALESLNRSDYGACLKSFMKTFIFMLIDGSGTGLKKMRFCGIPGGNSLYEDIIRNSSLSTIKSARSKICLKKMLHILWTTYSLDRLCTKHSPCFVICDDIAYHEGIFLKLFHKCCSGVYNVGPRGDGEIIFESNGNIRARSLSNRDRFQKRLSELGDEAVLWSEQYLKERYEGKNGRSIDRGAFSGKRVLSREEIIKEQNLDPQKKNVVIMAHTFTDAVFNYGDLYFRDYYDWTEQTLKLAGEIESVNWILKPHPTRSAYNESEDSIEDMYERYRKPHIFLLSDEVSAESMRNIADVLITIGGNAGAEFACEGIPAVIVGKPYYYGYGYTIEPATREEYEECLRKIDSVEKLDKEQIITAKKVFYLQNNIESDLLFQDEFANLVNRDYSQMVDEIALQYFASNEGTQKYNDRLMKQIIDYFKSHNMKECEYYKRGALRGKEYKK